MFPGNNPRKVTDPNERCPKCDGYGDKSVRNRSYGPSTYTDEPCEECGGTGKKKETKESK